MHFFGNTYRVTQKAQFSYPNMPRVRINDETSETIKAVKLGLSNYFGLKKYTKPTFFVNRTWLRLLIPI